MKATVTLGVQAGDTESSDTTRPAFLPLRKQLERRCTGAYSPIIGEFAIVLRISGALWRFEGEGVRKVRVSRKEAYITCDYAFPESHWKGVPLAQIKEHLAAAIIHALEAMSAHLKKLKIEVDSAKLLNDAREAITEFINERTE